MRLQLSMDHLPKLLLLLLMMCSSGSQTDVRPMSEDPVRLVGGDRHCTGGLEMNHEGEWRPVFHSDWTLQEADVVCRRLDCGSAVSVGSREESSDRYVWWITPSCFHFGSARMECARLFYTPFILNLNCSDSVRLLDGTSLCSGRLEVRSNQGWSSVCEADFDQQDAEVVCRELGCGALSALQGGLYGEVEAPVWSKEFQCGVHESALLNCSSSDSTRTTCSPGKAVGLTCSEPDEFRLVGGDSPCAGGLELKHEGEWRPVDGSYWSLKEAAVVCRQLDCGSAVSLGFSGGRSVWWLKSDCVQSGSALRECVKLSYFASSALNLNCSDSVRLLDGTGLCSGRLEVRSNQGWSSVCEFDFDHQDAEVVCRELGCGAPSVLQGGLYGEVKDPVWSKEFQCGSHESALLNCSSSDLARTTCSAGKAVGLTCSEPLRLVGGHSRCAGGLELKREGEWRPVEGSDWTLKEAAVVCRQLDCGSAVSVGKTEEWSGQHVWVIEPNCRQSGSALGKCSTLVGISTCGLTITCSDSVRLLDGTGLCSGRLEVRSNQGWSSVCEADFDQQDAEVVCRQLGCGAPSVLQGGLYGEREAPVWSKEFQCGGHESALLDCSSSGSARTTCSAGKAVGLTCSEPDAIRLVGGDSHCVGGLELKHEGEWRPVDGSDWTLKEAAVACKELDCGSAVFVNWREDNSGRPLWKMSSDCVQSGSTLRECVIVRSYLSGTQMLTCSDSVRLLDGTGLCSGRLEVRSNQGWSSVCEFDFDHQDAEVVCRELGCGAPSVLQGGLYREVKDPVWSKEFQCGGHESALLNCSSSDSARTTCSAGKAVGLTCSEPDEIRLVGGDSRCAGGLELKHEGEWRPVDGSDWILKEAAVVCRQLDCGSAVSIEGFLESLDRPVWKMSSDCVQSGSALRECVGTSSYISDTQNLTCSDLLFQPVITVSSVDGVFQARQQGFQVRRGSSFTISCSIQPQYPGGSFQLFFSSSNAEHSYIQLAVNHSAHFLFPVAEPTHQGNYICVYQVHVFSHNFSSESRRLFVSVSDPTVFLLKVVFLPLTLLLLSAALYLYCETTRRQTSTRQEDTELVTYPPDIGAALE